MWGNFTPTAKGTPKKPTQIRVKKQGKDGGKVWCKND